MSSIIKHQPSPRGIGLAFALLSALVLVSCGGFSLLDPGADPGIETNTASGDIRLKFALPSGEAWTANVSAAKLNLYSTYKNFYDAAPTYSFTLGIETSGTEVDVLGTCYSIAAGSYLVEVKLTDSIGASLWRHLGSVAVAALTQKSLDLSFHSTSGALALISSQSSAIVGSASTTNLAITDSSGSTTSIAGLAFTNSSSYAYALVPALEAGTYSLVWDFYNSSGVKIGAGSAPSLTVAALATTKQSVTIASSR